MEIGLAFAEGTMGPAAAKAASQVPLVSGFRNAGYAIQSWQRGPRCGTVARYGPPPENCSGEAGSYPSA